MPTEIITAIIALITALLTVGGIGYLIIEHILNKDSKKAEVEQQKVATCKDIIGNGITMLDLYKEMDQIVESKTKPLENKIDKLTINLERYGCFRDKCAIRVKDSSNVTDNEDGAQ